MRRTEFRNCSLLVLVAAMALAFAACGGSSGPPPPEPTKGTPVSPPASSSQASPLTPEQQASGQVPPGHPPMGAPADGGISAPPPGAGTGASGMSWIVPKGWIEEQPSSNMRRAQYRVPGPGGDGECAVFYFGPGQGGDPRSNALRWAGQFVHPDGKSTEAATKTSEIKVGDINVLLVETTGTYTGGTTMGMQPVAEKPGYALLGAVAAGPDSNWFFKFTGPEKTVQSQRDAFEAMMKSLKKGS